MGSEERKREKRGRKGKAEGNENQPQIVKKGREGKSSGKEGQGEKRGRETREMAKGEKKREERKREGRSTPRANILAMALRVLTSSQWFDRH